MTIVGEAQKFYSGWSSEHPVYDVHLASKERFSDIFEYRSYLIERDDGGLAGFRIGFVRLKGVWYIFDLSGARTDKFIREMLKMSEVRAGV